MKKEKRKRRLFRELAENYASMEKPACAHFPECGGCLLQNVPYPDQLLLKRDYLRLLLEDVAPVERVIGEEPYRYRNRMDFVTAFGKIGLRKAGSFRHVVDIKSCAITQERSNSLLKAIRPFLREVEDFNYLNHTGYLRYVVLRQGYYTGQTMLNFVISRRENLLQPCLDTALSGADSVSLILSEGKADLSYGEIMETLKGGSIEARFDDITFRYGPNSFFQSNSSVSLALYRKIREEVKGRVLDLYSGVGSISLFVAGKAESVTGVEIVPEAVEMAGRNRELNGTGNAGFRCADALDFLKEDTGRYDTFILDPPRSGMHPKVLREIRRLAPEKILYLSCNPASFREDRLGLEEYNLESFEAHDMFPQTSHVETLAVLKRRN